MQLADLVRERADPRPAHRAVRLVRHHPVAVPLPAVDLGEPAQVRIAPGGALQIPAELDQAGADDPLHNMTAANRFYQKHGFRRLDRPLLDTGHFSCDVWYLRDLP